MTPQRKYNHQQIFPSSQRYHNMALTSTALSQLQGIQYSHNQHLHQRLSNNTVHSFSHGNFNYYSM
eukprot:1166781-Ditylum_brightwellii.AAC.1